MSKIDDSEFKIFVVYHRGVDELPENFNDRSIYQPIQAGAAIEKNEKIVGSLYDNEGEDNYSNLNLFINEWTAYYWLYKNLNRLFPNLKYIGCFHYSKRLDFSLQHINNISSDFFMGSFIGLRFPNPYNFAMGGLVAPESVSTLSDENRLISFSLENIAYYKFLQKFIQKYPKYSSYFKQYILRNDIPFVEANMFICSREIFDLYGQFISEILGVFKEIIYSSESKEFFNNIKFQLADRFDKNKIATLFRVYGFITESITSFFVFLLITNFWQLDHKVMLFKTNKHMIDSSNKEKIHMKNIEKHGVV